MMSVSPPFTNLQIARAARGFYEGYSLPIAFVSKGIMVALVIWALVWPGSATSVLGGLNGDILGHFNVFYIVVVGFFAFFLFAVAVIPATGRIVMGKEGEKPEFSTFSWFSMMFGAGLGVGLMVFSIAEPVGLWGSNPTLIEGDALPRTAEAVEGAYRYTFAHYGFHAWAIYVTTGLSLAYYAYTRGMPLTIRTALTPLFGKAMNGVFGHAVDVMGVVATILGVSVTIGFGVSQFIDGLYSITGMGWLMIDPNAEAPKPSTVGLVVGLVCIMALSIISAVSGVGRGVKYLSNLNLVLSLILLLTFVIFGSFLFAMTTYAEAFVDYILHFVQISFGAYGPQSVASFTAALPEEAKALVGDLGGAMNAWGSFDSFKGGLEGAAASLSDETLTAVYEAGKGGRHFGWQSAWTTFYWAWWIAFSPFVGLFLARISRGRSVREFVVGCLFAPALVCFAWMTILGGTAIDLELSGVANGAITGATNTAMLFVTLEQIITSPFLLAALTVMSVVLILTFLVTSADSGILVMNTIMSGGDQNAGILHRIIWGIILTLVIGTLLVAGNTGSGEPMEALKNAMIIGALPFTFVMALMCVALAKAMYRDHLRSKV